MGLILDKIGIGLRLSTSIPIGEMDLGIVVCLFHDATILKKKKFFLKNTDFLYFIYKNMIYLVKYRILRFYL